MTLLLQDTLVISPKTKQQVEKNTAAIAELQEKSAIAYHFKGSKPTFNDLPTTGNEVGDVWDVQDTGANYGWTGTEWDELGPIADLEPYLTKEEAAAIYSTKTETNAQLDEKADKAEVYRSLSNEQETVLLSTGKYNGETVLTGDLFTSESGVFKSYSESPVPASWKSRGTQVFADLAAYGNGIWVVFSTMGNRYSYDGMTFYRFSYSGSVDDDCSLTFGNGKFLLVRTDGVVSYSEDGKNWIDVNDTGLPTTLGRNIAGFGNGRFVVVNGSTTTYYSDDGISWTPVTHEIPVGVGGRKILYGNGVFFLSSEISVNDHYFYSTDGIHWNASNLQGTNLVTYGNGKFVAVYYSGESRNLARVSTDGITWTNVDRIAFRTYAGILTFCDGLFIGENSFNTLISTDGENWTITDDGVSSSNSPTYAVSETTVLIFAPSGALYAYEPNSVDRTLTPLSYTKEEVDALIPEPVDSYTKEETDTLLDAKADKTEVYRSLTSDQESLLLLTGKYNDEKVNSGEIFLKENGTFGEYNEDLDPNVDWKKDGVVSGSLPTSESFMYGSFVNNTFVISGHHTGSRTILSSDGVSWTSSRFNDGNTHYHFSEGNGIIISARGPYIYTHNPDNILEILSTSPSFGTSMVNEVSATCYGGGKFIANTLNSGTYYSEDGISWTSAGKISGSNLNGNIAYGNGRFVFISGGVSITYTNVSEDGVHWTQKGLLYETSDTVLFGHNKFVLVSNLRKKFAYSEDGISWTFVPYPDTSKSVSYFAFDGERFIAQGSNTLFYSLDGMNWGSMDVSNVSGGPIIGGNGVFVLVQGKAAPYYLKFGNTIKSILPLSYSKEEIDAKIGDINAILDEINRTVV